MFREEQFVRIAGEESLTTISSPSDLSYEKEWRRHSGIETFVLYQAALCNITDALQSFKLKACLVY